MTLIAGEFALKSPFVRRNMQMVLLRSEGVVYRIIGVEFGISAVRVRQIWLRHSRHMKAPEDSIHGKSYRKTWQKIMKMEPPPGEFDVRTT